MYATGGKSLTPGFFPPRKSKIVHLTDSLTEALEQAAEMDQEHVQHKVMFQSHVALFQSRFFAMKIYGPFSYSSLLLLLLCLPPHHGRNESTNKQTSRRSVASDMDY